MVHTPLEGNFPPHRIPLPLMLINMVSLAGMVHKVGLLPPNNFEQVPFAYKMYLRTDTIGWEQSNEFKKAFCINVDIEFIGVWLVNRFPCWVQTDVVA